MFDGTPSKEPRFAWNYSESTSGYYFCIMHIVRHETSHSTVPQNSTVQNLQTLFLRNSDAIHPELWNRSLVYETRGKTNEILVHVRVNVGKKKRD